MSQAEREFRSNTTNDKQKYIAAWSHHVDQLTSLGMPLISKDAELYKELTAMQDRLRELVLIAADSDFGEDDGNKG